ncbi:hypothetical protein EBZ39_17770 [bacterium]|nr:hypothetical protein [bacterium]
MSQATYQRFEVSMYKGSLPSSPEGELSQQAFASVIRAIREGDIHAPADKRGALIIYIPLKVIQLESADPSKTFIENLKKFIRFSGLDVFQYGYDVVGFFYGPDEYAAAEALYNLCSGPTFNLWPAHLRRSS